MYLTNIFNLNYTDAGFPVDSIEDASTIEIKADLPGVEKSDVSVTHAKNLITIRAERPCWDGSKKEYTTWLERPCGKMERMIRFADPIEEGTMKASLQDGILTVTAKKTTAQSSKIDVL